MPPNSSTISGVQYCLSLIFILFGYCPSFSFVSFLPTGSSSSILIWVVSYQLRSWTAQWGWAMLQTPRCNRETPRSFSSLYPTSCCVGVVGPVWYNAVGETSHTVFIAFAGFWLLASCPGVLVKPTVNSTCLLSRDCCPSCGSNDVAACGNSHTLHCTETFHPSSPSWPRRVLCMEHSLWAFQHLLTCNLPQPRNNPNNTRATRLPLHVSSEAQTAFWQRWTTTLPWLSLSCSV